MFAHWTEVSKALLAGEVPPVFRLKKRKVDDMTEVSLQSFFLKFLLVVFSKSYVKFSLPGHGLRTGFVTFACI